MIAQLPFPEAALETKLIGGSLRIAGRRDYRYQLQASGDLESWEDVGAETDATGSYLSFVLPQDGEREFYRIAIL